MICDLELFQPAYSSRPGPVCECGERIFRTSLHGKYIYDEPLSSVDLLRISSCHPPVPNLLPSCSSVERTAQIDVALGRTEICFMEAPDTPSTVEPLQPAFTSRPGPVRESVEGVFQTTIDGKYEPGVNASSTDPLSVFSRSLYVYYQNVGGVNTCIDDYRLACADDCYDIIALSETWLNENTISVLGYGSNYEIFRTDRSSHNSSKSIGGGVLIAVHRRLKAQLVESTPGRCVEQVWVRVQLADFSLFICVIYIPPDRCRDVSLITSHIESLHEIASNQALPIDEILVVGDFNFPSLNWCATSDEFLFADPALSAFHAGITTLLDGYNLNLLRQFNHIVNENGRMLDLCFSSKTDIAPNICVAPSPLVKCVRHHPPLHIVLETKRLPHDSAPSSIISYNFNRADYNSMTAFLMSIDWDDILDNDDVNAAVQTFSNVLIYAIDYFVPKRSVRHSKHPPWLTAELKHLKTSKRAALTRYSKYGGYVLRNNYIQINKLYKKTVKRCHANYLKKVQHRIKSNPKAFWKHVNEQRKEFGLPSLMRFGERTGSSTQEICQLFSEQFARVFSTETLSPQQIERAAINVPVSNCFLHSIDIDVNSVQKTIAGLKSSSSAGPDGIPAVILKKCSAGIISPLYRLFRTSFTTAVFPDLWKASFMYPVYKKGDKSDMNNYRVPVVEASSPRYGPPANNAKFKLP
ncbi:uncharacterized protein LOC131428655 [Malaya genurostris]|uniref:uncharacterized protein LOC131428655 n=1 Tax=Malaya genurostris TaxID=325434 RepID=UPI0026F39014|nr:uncharacterized protein LOC131428655 [Malaya genurostris]